MTISLAITLGACTSTTGGSPAAPGAKPTPTPDQALVPKAPTDTTTAVDAAIYDDGFGWFAFKVGNGPTWCTITPETDRVLCEQNEAAATYQPIPAPADCEGSYGYQVELWSKQPETGKIADFACASGQFNDPAVAQVLPSGSKISVGSITCVVEDVTARCDNMNGQWIALGPKTWSLNN